MATEPSWIGARGGKWHVAAGDEPRWDRAERAQCGISFQPLNVTWHERPPTNNRYVCVRCKPEWADLPLTLAKDCP